MLLNNFKIQILSLILFFPLMSLAQKDQDPDTLIWNGRRYLIDVERNVPSIIQVYYQRTSDPSPFTHWSSNNTRGHVATFELFDDGISIVSIEAKRFRTRRGNLWAESGIDTVVSPDYFDMHLVAASTPYGSGPLLADWFSGVIRLSLLPKDKAEAKSKEADGHRYLHIQYGKIVDNVFVSFKDYKQLENSNEVKELKEQHDILALYDRFMNFYTRCALDREQVIYNGHQGLFSLRQNGLTLVMDLYGNDPLRWCRKNDAYGNGAPFGLWIIHDDSVFIKEVQTHWGDDLYVYESRHVNLKDALNDDVKDSSMYGYRDVFPDSSVFADWLAGDFVIHYGTWNTNSFGVPDYTVYKTQKLKVRDGVILSSQFSPRSFEDDNRQLLSSEVSPCNVADMYSVDDRQLSETVGNFKKPKKSPQYKGGKTLMRNWFANHSLTDDRAKERLFRVKIGFLVNCDGKAAQWQVLNKSKGELFEYCNMVLDVVSGMPQRWEPAEDKKGNKVDCWQVLEFTVSMGSLSNADYK